MDGRSMSQATKILTGGCLCGAVRFEADGEPRYAGYCFCADCRKASGSGFAPFMNYPSAAFRVSGETRLAVTKAANGGNAVRNFCPACGSLLFGGIVGEDVEHTVYAGALDDPAGFKPTLAIFNRDRPDWVLLPPGLAVFETMPG